MQVEMVCKTYQWNQKMLSSCLKVTEVWKKMNDDSQL